MCFLEAFDRMNHTKLFIKLHDTIFDQDFTLWDIQYINPHKSGEAGTDRHTLNDKWGSPRRYGLSF